MIDKKMMAWGVGVGALALLGGALWRRRNQYELANKVVFITGGVRGLGLVLARRMLQHGAKVAVCGRDPHEVARADDQLRQYGSEVLCIVCDVTKREEVEATVMEIEGRLGPIDVLVNNAGVIQVGPVESMTIDDYEEAMRVHFFGPLHTTLAVLPSMKRRRTGRIANISSIGGKMAVPHLLPYSASKFALTGFTEGLRAEVKKYGISVTSVIPGLMRTGSAGRAYVKGQHHAEYAWFSMSSALPLITISAERAGRTIIRAIERGDAEVILGLPAKAASAFHALSTPTTTDFLALIDQYLLPDPSTDYTASEKREGREVTQGQRFEKFIEKPAKKNLEVT
jgi:short-subunit dehydrogenase